MFLPVTAMDEVHGRCWRGTNNLFWACTGL